MKCYKQPARLNTMTEKVNRTILKWNENIFFHPQPFFASGSYLSIYGASGRRWRYVGLSLVFSQSSDALKWCYTQPDTIHERMSYLEDSQSIYALRTWYWRNNHLLSGSIENQIIRVWCQQDWLDIVDSIMCNTWLIYSMENSLFVCDEYL